MGFSSHYVAWSGFDFPSGGSGGTTPTGTGLRHVTSGVEDGSAYTLSAADIPNLAASKITTGQMALARGGTGADLSASGASTHFLAQAADHSVSARAIAKTDMPFTGTPDGTKFLKDDQSWGTVSATNSFKGVVLARTSDLSVSANTATDVTWTRQVKTPSSDVSHSTSSSPANITCNNTSGTIKIHGILTWTSDAQYLSFKVAVLKNGTKVDEFPAYPYGGGSPINGPIPFLYVGDYAQNDVFKVQVFAQTGTTNGNVKGQISSVDSCICSVEVY